MHFLHDTCHRGSSLILYPLLFKNISRNSAFVFLLQRLVFQKVWSHNSVDLFEVLQDCQSRVLLLARHVLGQMVVRIQLHGGPPCLIESCSGVWRCPVESRVHVKGSDHRLFVARCWTSEHMVPLAKELRVLRGRLNLVIIIQRFFSPLSSNFVVAEHHFGQTVFAHLV